MTRPELVAVTFVATVVGCYVTVVGLAIWWHYRRESQTGMVCCALGHLACPGRPIDGVCCYGHPTIRVTL